MLYPVCNKLKNNLLVILILLLGFSGCQKQLPPRNSPTEEEVISAEAVFQVFITDFENGERFPIRYSSEGENVSPLIRWQNAPKVTESYAVVLEDLDAEEESPRYHWVIFNIPSKAEGLPEKMTEGERFSGGIIQGENDFGEFVYHGPEPVPGSHTYRFTVYALPELIEVKPIPPTAKEIVAELEELAIAMATIEGRR